MKKKSLYALPAVVLALILLASCTPREDRPSEGSEAPSLGPTEAAAASDTPSPTVLETTPPAPTETPEDTAVPATDEPFAAVEDDYYALCSALLRGETSDILVHVNKCIYLLEETEDGLGVYETDETLTKMRLVRTLPAELIAPAPKETWDERPNLFGYIGDNFAAIPYWPDMVDDFLLWYLDDEGNWKRMDRPEEKVGGLGITGACVKDEKTAFICYNFTECSHDTTIFDSCVYATFNGGKTWSHMADLDLPEEVRPYFYAPQYLVPVFNGNHGVIPVYVASDRRDEQTAEACTVWFETTDGGRTWVFRDRCDGRAFG